MQISTTGNQLQNNLIVQQVQTGANGIYKCKWCLKVFDKMSYLSAHHRRSSCKGHKEALAYGNVDIYKCKWCQSPFGTPQGLGVHLRMKHRDKEDLARGIHRCKWCDKPFYSIQEINFHLRLCGFNPNRPKNITKNITITATPPPTTPTTTAITALNPRKIIKVNSKSDMVLTATGIKCCLCSERGSALVLQNYNYLKSHFDTAHSDYKLIQTGK